MGQDYAAFEGLEASSREEKLAGQQAQSSLHQASSHVKQRLVSLRWRLAFDAASMEASQRLKLAEHKSRVPISKSEPMLDQVTFVWKQTIAEKASSVTNCWASHCNIYRFISCPGGPGPCDRAP